MAKKRRGFFITLEGPDGSGKSTQLFQLAKRLTHAGYQVITTREPGGNPLAEKIRALLLAKQDEPPTPEAELFLFLAARAQHVQHLILPALQQHKVVLCERFIDSTYAYQVGGRCLPESLVRAANRLASQNLKPDLTLLLNLPSHQGLRRAFQAKYGLDRMESESRAFIQRVQRSYLHLARQEPKRIRLIQANGRISEVANKIWQEVQSALSSWPQDVLARKK